MSFNLDNIPDKSQLTAIPENQNEKLKMRLKNRIYNKLAGAGGRLPINIRIIRLELEDVTALCEGLAQKGYTCTLQNNDKTLVIN
jgi:hypothetical protein